MSSSSCSRSMKGWLSGCGAATAVIATFPLAVSVIASSRNSSELAGGSLTLLFAVLLIFVVTCLLTGIPAALVIWLSEKFGIRSILFFGCTGAVTGALGEGILVGAFRPWPSSTTWLFVVAGFAAGMAYWRIAGRYAGRSREVSADTA